MERPSFNRYYDLSLIETDMHSQAGKFCYDLITKLILVFYVKNVED